MERRTRMWEDRPKDGRYISTREELMESVEKADRACKYFWCESCGAEKGERCKASVDDGYDELGMRWREDWDAHERRIRRWEDATELERAMLKAMDDEIAS